MTTNRIVVDVPVEGTANVVAHVEHRGEIHGTVVDLHFRPASGARVSLADGSVRPVVADRNGSFTIENVDGAVDLIARRGSEASPFQHLQVGAGERVDVVLQVGPTGISGTAVDHHREARSKASTCG